MAASRAEDLDGLAPKRVVVLEEEDESRVVALDGLVSRGAHTLRDWRYSLSDMPPFSRRAWSSRSRNLGLRSRR